MVGFLETCRTARCRVYCHEQGLDTETSQWNVAVRYGRHDGAARPPDPSRSNSTWSGCRQGLSIRFGRPPIPRAKVEKAKHELAAGRGVREAGRLAGISAASVSRLKNAMSVRHQSASEAPRARR